MVHPRTPRVVMSTSHRIGSTTPDDYDSNRDFVHEDGTKYYHNNKDDSILNMTTNIEGLIPFCLSTKTSGKWRALFLVPTYLVDRLTMYPIVCRGSMFELSPEENDYESPLSKYLSVPQEGGITLFLRADFVSPYPHEVALAIAQRLSFRIEQAQEDYQIEQQQQREQEERGREARRTRRRRRRRQDQQDQDQQRQQQSGQEQDQLPQEQSGYSRSSSLKYVGNGSCTITNILFGF